MSEETRQEQYLRILESEPEKTLSDYEVAKWLIDKGYAKGAVRDLSHFRHPTDDKVQYVWQGVTHEGRIFMEQLRNELKEANQQLTNQEAKGNSEGKEPTAQGVVSQSPPPEAKLWYERTSLRAFIFLVLVAVVSMAISKWFGLS